MAKKTVGRTRTTATSRTKAVLAKTQATDTPAGSAPTPSVATKRATRLPKTVAAVVKAAHAKQAEHVVVLDLRKSGGFTDYFVICTGANARQIVAIADAVRDTLKSDFGERPVVAEGLDRAEWVLLDYFDFVVHVFSRECRGFYNLERLWGNAERTAADED